MKIGLELIHNGKIVVATTPQHEGLIILGISALGDIENSYISFQSLNISNNEKSKIFYNSKISIQDKIVIKVKEIQNITEKIYDYKSYINSIRLQRYNYLHNVLNDLMIDRRKMGVKFNINGKISRICLLKQRNINFVINHKENYINLSLGATDNVSDTLATNKTWFESHLLNRDEIFVELKYMDKETPYISKSEYLIECPKTRAQIFKDYKLLKDELTKEGILH